MEILNGNRQLENRKKIPESKFRGFFSLYSRIDMPNLILNYTRRHKENYKHIGIFILMQKEIKSILLENL